MIERFNYYINENLVRETSPNREESLSLMKKAEERLKYIETQKITSLSSSFVFEDIYESVREAAQSLMSMKGYKPYSHEALISFLGEFFNFSEHNISTLNRYRILRNKCIYKADRVSIQTCEEAMIFLKNFLPEIKREFNKIL